MTDSIKIHLYHVHAAPNTPAITTVFAEAQATQLPQRLRMLGNNEVRLENILSPNGPENPTPYWFLDMTRLRFAHGPGKASRTHPVIGFPLTVNEGFGEETAALYDPTTGYMLVQYNHYGVRAPSIRDYFSFFNAGQSREYEFRVKLDEAAEAKLAQKQIITKIRFKVAPAAMTQNQRTANVGLGQALALNDSLNGQSVEIIVSSGQKRNSMLSTQNAKLIISGLRSLLSLNGNLVERFEVSGKGSAEDRAEAIDMLSPKFEKKIDGIVMGPDRRYTQLSRWNALLSARKSLGANI